MGKTKKGQPINGWVIFDKPEGMSSSQAVGKIRRIFNAQKAGHSGTLDPLASGVLPIALGEATKTVPYMMESLKAYRFAVKFGQATSTDDREGDVVETSDIIPEMEDILLALNHFSGEITQVPPAYSAIKIDGKRAYALAREGKEFEIKSRKVNIYSLKLLEMKQADEAILEVECSKGTYVRSLARDIAKYLGSCGHVSYLRRTKCGKFSENNAILLDKLESIVHSEGLQEVLLPSQTALDDILVFAVNDEEADCIKHGQKVDLVSIVSRSHSEKPRGGSDVALMFNNNLLAIAVAEDEKFSPKRVMNY